MFQTLSRLIYLYACITTAVFSAPRVGNIIYAIEAGNYDFEFVYKFTKHLHSINRYKTFVFFSHINSRYRPNFIVVRDFEQALVEDFNVPIIVWGLSQQARLRNNIGLNNLVFVQFKGLTDPILPAVDLTLEGLHFIPILFYYRNEERRAPTTNEIKQFFEWCWQRNMINAGLTFQSYEIEIFQNRPANVVIKNYVYKYTPFPKLTIYDLTEKVQKGDSNFMIDHLENVHGYEFLTPITTSFPFVFLLKNPSNCFEKSVKCETRLSGTTGRLYAEYIKQINGKIKIVQYSRINYTDYNEKLILAASKKQVHIGVHPFSALSIPLGSTEGSYPISQTNVCVIVPLMREHDKSKYFQSPYQPLIWILIFLIFLLLILVQIRLQNEHLPYHKNCALSNFGEAFITTASMLLYQAYIAKLLYKSSSVYKLLHVFILLMVFLLSTMYSASLTSFLSSIQLTEQIDTLEQFLSTDLKILLSENDKQVYFEKATLPLGLTKHLEIADRATVATHKNNLNNSFAYILTSDQWQMLDYKQKYLTKPLFRMPSAELCSETYYVMLPLQWNSPFEHSLTLFFMATQESGLSQKWQDMSIAEAKQLKLIEVNRNNEQQWRPLKWKDYFLVAFLIGTLWLLALTVFFGEIFVYKKKKKNFQKFNHRRRTQYNKYQRKRSLIKM